MSKRSNKRTATKLAQRQAEFDRQKDTQGRKRPGSRNRKK